MKSIEEIIKTLDDEMIEKGLRELTLQRANQLLVSKSLITAGERIDQEFKKALQNNLIPHAYQTSKSPKQWIIPLSAEGQERFNQMPKKQKEVTKYDIPWYTNKENNKYVYWGIGVIIFIAILIANLSSDQNTGGNSISKYVINTDTYASYSKEIYDDLFQHLMNNDLNAVTRLENLGLITVLHRGKIVYLKESHFSYCIVRLEGSFDDLYVVTDHLTKQ